ncbi:MAG: DUF6364 family protein [Luteibaculum sp.]
MERAKQYAKDNKISVSKLIEAYLNSLTSGKGDSKQITPLVQSLSGIVSIDKNYDYKRDYSDFLMSKYK